MDEIYILVSSFQDLIYLDYDVVLGKNLYDSAGLTSYRSLTLDKLVQLTLPTYKEALPKLKNSFVLGFKIFLTLYEVIVIKGRLFTWILML